MQANNIKMHLVTLLEFSRYSFAGIGFYLAYNSNISMEHSLSILLLLVVVPLAGFTGIESIFLSRQTAKSKGREEGSAYQIQSGMNNLAISLTALIVWYWQWGIHASLTILFVLLIFFSLSSVNHSIEFITKSEKNLIHLLRPLLTLVLIAACLPIIIKVLT
jgi:Family of unknown function (DUF6790)